MMSQLPNALTILRIVLVPLIWKLAWDREYERVIAVGFVASMTDVIDGWLARRLNATSKFGALLDPVADKLMLSGTYLIFALDRVVPAWLPWIVLGRDAFILAMAACAWLFTKIRDFPPSRWGKLSTLVQILTALVILFNRSIWFDVSTFTFERWTLRVCAALTLWSGVHYAWLAIRRLRAGNPITGG